MQIAAVLHGAFQIASSFFILPAIENPLHLINRISVHCNEEH